MIHCEKKYIFLEKDKTSVKLGKEKANEMKISTFDKKYPFLQQVLKKD